AVIFERCWVVRLQCAPEISGRRFHRADYEAAIQLSRRAFARRHLPMSKVQCPMSHQSEARAKGKRRKCSFRIIFSKHKSPTSILRRWTLDIGLWTTSPRYRSTLKTQAGVDA